MVKVESFNPARASASNWLPITQEVPYPDERVLAGKWKGEVHWLTKEGHKDEWSFDCAVHRAPNEITIQTLPIEAWEFFYIMRGGFTVELESGETNTYSAGDAVHLERGLLSRNTYHAPFEQMIIIVWPSPGSPTPVAPRSLSIPGDSNPVSWSDVKEHHDVPAESVLEGEWGGRIEFLRNTRELYSGIYVTDTNVKLAVVKTGAEFVHVVAGEMRIEPKDGDARVFHAGDSVFFPPGYTGTIAYKAPFRQMVTVVGEAN